MEDADGILSDEPIIAFSDAILIYDGKKGLAGYNADDFWHVLRLTARKVGVLRTERLFDLFADHYGQRDKRSLEVFCRR